MSTHTVAEAKNQLSKLIDRALKGEALLAGAGTVGEAETAMQQGIDVARRPQEAAALLAPILGWFTEGFDTADLKTAKALLDELEKEVCPLRPLGEREGPVAQQWEGEVGAVGARDSPPHPGPLRP
jgi:hypothetical protein